jgi:hypothetical protein
MSKKNRDDEEWWRKHFPTVSARAAADKAIDAMDVKCSMSDFLDAWVAAYRRAGGVTPKLGP